MTTEFAIAFRYLWSNAWNEDKVKVYNTFAMATDKHLIHENDKDNLNLLFHDAYHMAEAIDDGHYRFSDPYFIITNDNALHSGDMADRLVALLLTDDEYEEFGNYLEDCGWTIRDLEERLP